MNQVMINAVELQALMDEIKYLKDENFKLKGELGKARDHIRILESEVAWAERGYTQEKHNG